MDEDAAQSSYKWIVLENAGNWPNHSQLRDDVLKKVR